MKSPCLQKGIPSTFNCSAYVEVKSVPTFHVFKACEPGLAFIMSRSSLYIEKGSQPELVSFLPEMNCESNLNANKEHWKLECVEHKGMFAAT
jgi:hypothetical protein